MLTVLTISSERPRYLERAIAYWSMCKWPMIIADASSAPMNGGGAPNIKYLHRPGVAPEQRVRELAANVATPYAVLVPDDDFVAFEGLEQAMRFLEANPGYVAAQGLYTRFSPGPPPGWVWDSEYASRFQFSDPSLEQRVIAGVTAPVMHYCYSLIRTAALRKVLAVLDGVTDPAASTFELTFNVALMGAGNIATVPVFYAAREAHPARWLGAMDIDEWLTKRTESGSARWRRNLAGLYTTEHGIPEESARLLVDRVIATYLDGYRAKRKAAPPQQQAPRRSLRSAVPRRLVRPAKYLLGGAWSATSELIEIHRMLGWDVRKHVAFQMAWRRMKKVIVSIPCSMN